MFLKRHTAVSEPAAHTTSTQNRCFWRIHKIRSKIPVLESHFNKVAVLRPATLLKKTPTQVLAREICKLFKNNYFEEHLWNAASKHYFKRDSNTVAFLWILWIIQEHLFSRRSTNGVRKWLPHSYFSVNFEKFLGNRFCRTPPSKHLSHDMTWFFLFVDQWDLQPKMNLFGGAMVN